MEKKIYQLLNELGVPFGLSGRDYLAAAIEVAYTKGRIGVTTELYPMVAERFNVPARNIERCMRNAIERTFDTAGPDKIKQFFGNTVSIRTGKLPNSDFIYGVAEYLKIYG